MRSDLPVDVENQIYRCVYACHESPELIDVDFDCLVNRRCREFWTNFAEVMFDSSVREGVFDRELSVILPVSWKVLRTIE